MLCPRRKADAAPTTQYRDQYTIIKAAAQLYTFFVPFSLLLCRSLYCKPMQWRSLITLYVIPRPSSFSRHRQWISYVHPKWTDISVWCFFIHYIWHRLHQRPDPEHEVSMTWGHDAKQSPAQSWPPRAFISLNTVLSIAWSGQARLLVCISMTDEHIWSVQSQFDHSFAVKLHAFWATTISNRLICCRPFADSPAAARATAYPIILLRSMSSQHCNCYEWSEMSRSC